MKKTPFLLLAAILMLACASLPFGSTPTPLPTATSTPTVTFTPSPTSTPTLTLTPTPTPTIGPPEPPVAGYSNVYGRVLWRGQPLEGVPMYLREDLSDVFGVSVDTDREGRFVFTQVTPGDGYILEVYSSFFVYSDLAGQVGAIPVTISVPPDSNFNYGEYYLFETDLILLAPERDSVFTEAPATLSWEAYPGAAYYHVELKQREGTYTDQEWDTDETHVDPELPLLNCVYGWDVTAYDPAGIPLARSDVEGSGMNFGQQYDGIFWIENEQLPSCFIEVNSPAPEEHITGGRVEFRWEPNPLAVRYHLRMVRTIGNYPFGTGTRYVFFSGDYVVQEDGSLAGPSLPYLGSGRYAWSLQAFTEDGGFIAASSSEFTVP